MTKKKSVKLTKVIRIRSDTERLLKAFNAKTIDAAIIKMWNKISTQGKEINEFRRISGCKNARELRILLDKLFNENNRLRELPEVNDNGATGDIPNPKTE
jgi:hypothetical protein